MSNSMPYNKLYLNNRCISKDYFSHNYTITPEIMSEVTKQSASLPIPVEFGIFLDENHYLNSVDLLISSITETQRRNEILIREILPSLNSFDNLLDIGVGNGDLTKLVGSYYKHITVLDNNAAALNNVPSYHYVNSSEKIDKIYSSVLDAEIPNKQYDLILLSHVLYYIDPNFRIPLINKLYNLLGKDGVILIIFTEGSNRYELTKHFNGTNFEFTDLVNYVQDNYPSFNIIEFEERIQTNAIEPMLHIAGVCLKDAATSAKANDLTEYLNLNHYDGSVYHIDMFEKIVLIGHLGEN